MASLHHLLIVAFSCFLLFNVSQSSRLGRIPGLLLPVRRDVATGLHRVVLSRTPALSIPYVIDLSSPILWGNCAEEYASSTYQALGCQSEICSRASASCLNRTCGLTIVSPWSRQQAPCELVQDVLSVPVLGSSLGQVATVQPFTFGCAPSVLLERGFSQEIRGVAGFGPSPIALPYQFASHFGYQHSFSLCLAPSSLESGAVFFGSAPSSIPFVGQTPLILGRQNEYCIGVRSIRIGGVAVQLQASLLQEGFLQALLSTTDTYMVLESSIYQVVVQTFVSQLQSLRQVEAIAPFGLCFDHASLGSLQAIPSIDLRLQSEKVWTLAAANLLVSPQPGVSCLAAVDGGLSPIAPLVLGTTQLENYLLQFDLQSQLLRFSSPLWHGQRPCSGLTA
ncbi:hypothetical protein Ancab_024142 [Ancistrocladus abbreviatus]